jgi:hypothetical protein
MEDLAKDELVFEHSGVEKPHCAARPNAARAAHSPSQNPPLRFSCVPALHFSKKGNAWLIQDGAQTIDHGKNSPNCFNSLKLLELSLSGFRNGQGKVRTGWGDRCMLVPPAVGHPRGPLAFGIVNCSACYELRRNTKRDWSDQTTSLNKEATPGEGAK